MLMALVSAQRTQSLYLLDLNFMKHGTDMIEFATQLFISYVKSHRGVTKDTIVRWIRTVMLEAGLDVETFRPHSTRSAATSKAKQACVPIQDILKHAGWSNERTFDRFYNKPVVTQDNKFAESVLH